MKYDRAHAAAESNFKKKEKPPVEGWRATAANDALLRSDTEKNERLKARRLNQGAAAAETAKIFSGKKEETIAAAPSADPATTKP